MPASSSPSSVPFISVRPLVLASGSPRRQALLKNLGLDFEVVSPEQAEPSPVPGDLPAVYAKRAARLKAEAGALLRPDAVVLAADTIVVLPPPPPEDRPQAFSILGKPADEQEAVTMLTRLSGRSHQVITACCLIDPEEANPDNNSKRTPERFLFHDSAEVIFGDWPESVLRAYAASGEPLDKAGAYAVQGIGAFLALRVTGSWSTVVGLPLDPVIRLLLDRNVIRPAIGDPKKIIQA